jgi:hypothetical protein
LLYGSETWNITARDAKRKTAAGYSFTDCKTNTEIAKVLIKTPILKEKNI